MPFSTRDDTRRRIADRLLTWSAGTARSRRTATPRNSVSTWTCAPS